MKSKTEDEKIINELIDYMQDQKEILGDETLSSVLNLLSDDSLLTLMINIRDRRAKRKEAYESEDAVDRNAQNKIEEAFLGRFSDRNVDSISKGSIKAYKTTRSSATISDTEAFLTHIKETENWGLLDVRAKKLAVEKYSEEKGCLPPGVKWNETLVVNCQK